MYQKIIFLLSNAMGVLISTYQPKIKETKTRRTP